MSNVILAATRSGAPRQPSLYLAVAYRRRDIGGYEPAVPQVIVPVPEYGIAIGLPLGLALREVASSFTCAGAAPTGQGLENDRGFSEIRRCQEVGAFVGS